MTAASSIERLLGWTKMRSASLPAPRRFALLMDRCAARMSPSCCVKVAGTNGKGSVCRLLESGLLAAGRSVGTFTSPHLERMTERIRIDGREIDAVELESRATKLERQLHALAAKHGDGYVPSFFEVLLLIALQCFNDAGVEYALIEAGIGGGHDATSAIPGELSVVTTISLDHEDKLGSDVLGIARDKADVASDNSELIVGPGLSPALVAAMDTHVQGRGVRVRRAEADASPRPPTTILWAAHQRDNFATAAHVLQQLGEPDRFDVRRAIAGMSESTLPGRRERIGAKPTWLLDVAHNAGAIETLIDALNSMEKPEERVLLFGVSRERRDAAWLSRLPEIAGEIYIADDFNRATTRSELMPRLPDNLHVHRSPETTDDIVSALEGFDGTVVVTGSVFLVGRVRGILRDRGHSLT